MRLLPTLVLVGLALVSPARAADLTVTVLGAAESGLVRGMLFRDAASFERKEDPVARFALPPQGGRVVVRRPALAPGRYALALAQDRNGNDRLDKTMIGLPTEPYGFSNDASAPFGPPDFDQAAFVVGGESHAITLHLR